MAVIGFTTWTRIARFMRGELLRVRNLEFIEAAQALGFKNFTLSSATHYRMPLLLC